jgi:hypothetical protein
MASGTSDAEVRPQVQAARGELSIGLAGSVDNVNCGNYAVCGAGVVVMLMVRSGKSLRPWHPEIDRGIDDGQ